MRGQVSPRTTPFSPNPPNPTTPNRPMSWPLKVDYSQVDGQNPRFANKISAKHFCRTLIGWSMWNGRVSNSDLPDKSFSIVRERQQKEHLFLSLQQ